MRKLITLMIAFICFASMNAEDVTISNAQDLMNFAQRVNNGEGDLNAVLSADIDMDGIADWTPIGQHMKDYKGHFDGQGHRILNLKVENTGNDNQALFGQAIGPAIIENVIIDATCTIKGAAYTAGILGHVWGDDVIVRNCGNEGTIVGSGGNAAGIIGCSEKIVHIDNCYNTGSITGKNESAAICAWMGSESSTIKNCFNKGTVTGQDDDKRMYRKNEVIGQNLYDIDGQQATKITEEQVSSGKLCYLLNGNVQGGVNWYQNLSGTVDAYPVPFSSHKKVYKFGSAESYLNDGSDVTISSATDLDNFSQVVNDGATSLNANLNAEISATTTFTPIGTDANMYKGTFNGNNHSITLSIDNDNSTISNRALIGFATGGATIQNLILKGSVNSKGSKTASFIAEAKGGGTVTITNCGNEAAITGGGGETAAIIANNLGASCSLKLTNVYNIANVSGSGDVSTICGSQGNYQSVFTNVYNSGVLSDTDGDLEGHFARGTINQNSGNPTSIGTYTRCYSTTLNSNTRHDNPEVTKIRKIEASDVSSGELTCLLNGSTDGSGTDFYQSLGTDNYPVLDSSHGKVWKSLCAEHDDEIQYSNSEIGQSTSHVFDEPNATGHCTQCQRYFVFKGAQMKSISDGISAGTIDNDIHIYFTQDIDFAGVTGYAGIGTDTDGKRFCGILDGQGHSVKNMKIDSKDSGVGLIGTVSDGADIRNVIVTNSCEVKGNQYVAGIVGTTNGTGTGTVKITRCGNEADVEATRSGNSNAAGILGCRRGNNRIEISNCYNAGTIKGQVECAGISAWMGTNFSLNKCYNIGSIDSKVENAQYLVRVDNNTSNWNGASSITDCYQINTNNNFEVKDTTYTKSPTTYTIKAISSDVFASGELCYELNGKQDAGTDWYQTLGTDNYPVLFDTHEKIYCVVDQKCDGTDAPSTYKNSTTSVVLPHEYDDGWCTVCNAYQENALSPIDGWYQISNAKQLRWIAESVNEYNSTYNGINIKLTSDIDYSAYTDQAAMIGKPSNTYKGTFDGQNHTVTVAFNNTQAEETALFRRIIGGTVKNLKVNGTITTDKKFAAGICSGIWDYGSITNCESAVTITDNESDDATHGGILARVNNIDNKKNIKVLNCLFSGTLNAPDRSGCGGIVGWTDNNANVKVKNCLVSGTLTIADANTNGIIARSSGDIENNYYTCTVSGSKINKDYATEASDKIGTGELCYLLNGSTSGGTGWYQTIGTDDMPTPFNSSSVVYANGKFQCDGVTPKGTITYGNTDDTEIDSHNFVNSLCSVCKAVGEEPSNVEGVYQIANIGNLIWFASHVNSGNTTASGVLTDNIVQGDAVYVPIGTEDNIYTGRFDGQGHTVDLNLNNPTKNFQGLFGVVTDGVFIEKVTVTGSVHGNNYVGGIVGGTKGGSSNALQTNIWYCGNEATITADGLNAGGIIGVNMGEGASIIITNCYNRGNIQGKNQSGALSGWLGGGWSSVRNCYNTGTVKNGETVSKAFGRNSGCFFKNCYYTTSSGTDNSTENTTNGVPAGVEGATVASGVLCAKLGYGFRQNLEEDAYPNFNVNHGFVNQISSVGYSTQYNAMSDVTIPAGVEAFAGVKNGDRVTLVPVVGGKIKAGVPVVLKASKGCYNFMPTTGADEITNNDLRGSDGFVDFGENIYVLANKTHGIGFYKTEDNGKNVPEGRAYLDNSGRPVKEAYLFSFDDEETAITNVNVNGNGNNAAIYNMAGQRISKLQKGINIVNGKKVLF